MTTINGYTLTEAQEQWLSNWLAGLRSGELSTGHGFVRKLTSVGFTLDQVSSLISLESQPETTGAILADAVEAIIQGGV